MKLSEKLKIETSSLHKDVERTEVNCRLLSQNLTLKEYGYILQLYYWAFKSQENAILKHNLPIPYRPRAQLIEEDLALLGVETCIPKYFTCDYDSSLHALGALYVLIGSNEGSRFIRKRVISILGEDRFTSGGISFFSAYLLPYYEQDFGCFKSELDFYANTLTDLEQQQVIDGAKEAFVHFKMTFSSLPN